MIHGKEPGNPSTCPPPQRESCRRQRPTLTPPGHRPARPHPKGSVHPRGWFPGAASQDVYLPSSSVHNHPAVRQREPGSGRGQKGRLPSGCPDVPRAGRSPSSVSVDGGLHPSQPGAPGGSSRALVHCTVSVLRTAHSTSCIRSTRTRSPSRATCCTEHCHGFLGQACEPAPGPPMSRATRRPPGEATGTSTPLGPTAQTLNANVCVARDDRPSPESSEPQMSPSFPSTQRNPVVNPLAQFGLGYYWCLSFPTRPPREGHARGSAPGHCGTEAPCANPRRPMRPVAGLWLGHWPPAHLPPCPSCSLRRPADQGSQPTRSHAHAHAHARHIGKACSQTTPPSPQEPQL